MRSLAVLALCALSTTAHGEAQRPGVAPARQEEDWSVLKDNALSTGWLDSLKYVELEGGGRSWLSLGGELRTLYEIYDNENYGAIPGRDGYLLTRVMIHGSLARRDTFGLDRLRLWVELKGGYIDGREAPTRPPDADDADFNGLFVEASEGLFGGDLTLRVGRQELHYGSARLVSVREGPTTRRPFDGALLRWQQGRVRIDAFAVRPNETDPGAFDNQIEDDEEFWGAYATLPFPKLANFSLDLIYFGNDRAAVFDQGAGNEQRQTIGWRWHTRQRHWRHDLLAVYQFGNFRQQSTGAGGDIQSFTVSTDTSYGFVEHPLRPRVGVFIGYTPGDDDPQDADLQTFRAPYPPGRYLVTASLLGPENLVFVQGRLELELRKDLRLLLGHHWLWRESLQDGLYSTPGGLLRSGQQSNARRVGTIQQLVLDYALNQYLSFSAEFSHFDAGPFLRESSPGEDFDYAGLRAVFRF